LLKRIVFDIIQRNSKDFGVRCSKLANIKSSIKRIKTNERDRDRNVEYRSKIKTLIKKTNVAIGAKSADVESVLKETIKAVDTISRKGVIHKNKAARIKSRLTKKASVSSSN